MRRRKWVLTNQKEGPCSFNQPARGGRFRAICAYIIPEKHPCMLLPESNESPFWQSILDFNQQSSVVFMFLTFNSVFRIFNSPKSECLSLFNSPKSECLPLFNSPKSECLPLFNSPKSECLPLSGGSFWCPVK
jgi:hypothetical protein